MKLLFFLGVNDQFVLLLFKQQTNMIYHSIKPILFSSVIFCLSILLLSYSSPEQKVYICKGKSATKYHLSSSCRGLNRCSTDTYEVTLEEVQKMGRTLCGWED